MSDTLLNEKEVKAIDKAIAKANAKAIAKANALKEKKEKKEKEKTDEKWSFYIIVHTCGATYAGVSPDPVKRLRKHNGEIAGGAKYTLSKENGGWQHVCLVHGFQSKIQALQFEWASKHVPPRNAGGLQSRIKKLYLLFNKLHWTSKSPEASFIPLHVEWKMAVAGIDDRSVPAYISDLPF